MTGLSTFTPGGELRCHGCEYCIGSVSEPDCLIAVELRDDGEQMHECCCPADLPARPSQCEGDRQSMPHDAGKFCPVCGGDLPCLTCLSELRSDA